MTNELIGVLENATLEVNVTITETGPRGLQGEQGEQGPKGDKGDKGEPGSSFLPVASGDVIGGIMVGENLKIVGGVLSVDTTALQTYVDTVILGGAS